MKTTVTVEKEMNTSADEVWRIIGIEFSHIGDWASGIHRSCAIESGRLIDNAPVHGRTCTVDGLGDVTEKITAFNHHDQTFTFEITAGLPGFIVSSYSDWKITSKGLQRCSVQVHSVTELKFFPGILVAPVIKLQGRAIVGKVLRELAWYAENGELHPDKAAALAGLKT